ncbi:MAG: hypothetical protein PF518_02060 [Spirochaetaceae bacterium]|jgi:AAA15 family ATPase/GTPase|nr:hypothetical protein [Spirochaetaceae bacterium]
MSADDTIFKVKGYKGFQEDFGGFDSIKPINIIIGRNNTGKSSLLDIIKNEYQNYSALIKCVIIKQAKP